MGESHRHEVYAVMCLDALIIGAATLLALHVTPWALLMLVFLMGYERDATVTVTTTNGSVVEVTTSDLDETTIRQAVEDAEKSL